MCGGNGMGFMNQASKVRATGFLTPEVIRHGPVTFLSHSGSAFSALAFSDRGLGFNLLVSSGQEVVTTMADYMAYALDREETRVLALLLETVRDPEGFRAMLGRAAERDVAVLALKVGRTVASQAMVTAHSGALAGEHGAYEALFDAYGVHEVRSLDELADTMELFSSPRRVRRGDGVASVHDSGGERALFVDLAADLGVPFASVSDATIARIADTLDPGHGVRQPPRRVGNRHRRRPDLPRRVRGVRRRPRGERERVLRRHDAAGRALRRGVPRARARGVRVHDRAVLRAVEPGERGYARRDPDASRRGDPGVGGHGERSSRARAPVGRRRVPCATARRRRRGGGSSRPGSLARPARDRRAVVRAGRAGAASRVRARDGRRPPGVVDAERGRARDGDRLPGGAEDGGAGDHAQVRRRRGASRAHRRGWGAECLRGHQSDGSVRM